MPRLRRVPLHVGWRAWFNVVGRLGRSGVRTGGGAAGASDAGAGTDAASPAGEGGGNAAGDASTPVDKGAGDDGDAADDPVERAADDELAQQGVLYAFGKLMASGYVYACDERGDLTKPIDEDDPKRNAISAREVANLIVDYHVADIPEGLVPGLDEPDVGALRERPVWIP